MLEDSDFYVEVQYLKRLQKHLIAVDDLKSGEWVASIVFDRHPCATVGEAKSLLRELGVSETNRYLLDVTNDQTVSECLEGLEAELLREETDEFDQKVNLVNMAFLETFLKKGIINMSDGMLDAFRKILQQTET